MIVKFRFGTGNELSKELPEGTTMGCALGNQFIRGALGYGSNVEGSVGSVPQSNSLVLQDGMVVSIYDKPCSKA